MCRIITDEPRVGSTQYRGCLMLGIFDAELVDKIRTIVAEEIVKYLR